MSICQEQGKGGCLRVQKIVLFTPFNFFQNPGNGFFSLSRKSRYDIDLEPK